MAGSPAGGVPPRQLRPEETQAAQPDRPRENPPPTAGVPVDVERETRRAEATALGSEVNATA